MALTRFRKRTPEDQVPPPRELEQLGWMIGSWTGSGTFVRKPGAEPQAWTATSVFGWALDDTAIQEDTVVRVARGIDDTDDGDGALQTVGIRAMYAFDRATGRYMVLTASSLRGVESSQLTLGDDRTLVRVDSRVEDGRAVIERWLTRQTDDRIEITCQRSVGSGPTFVAVRGALERSPTPIPPPVFEPATFPPPSKEMVRLSVINGFYTASGTFRPTASAPPERLSGIETTVPLFGGIVLQSQLESEVDPELGAYRAWGVKGWDAETRYYDTVQVSNLSEVEVSIMRWVGDELVWTGQLSRESVPGVSRGVITVSVEHGVERVRSDVMLGTERPWQDFEATYERQEESP